MSSHDDIILINPQPAASTRKWLFNIDAGEWFTTSNGCSFSTVYNRACLVFDNAEQVAYSPCFRVPSGFGSGTVTAEICYTLATDTTTTHVAKFNIAIECISDGDSSDTDAAEYLGADNRICGMVPATAGYMKTCRATMKDNDLMAAGDCCRLRLTRAGTDAEDTATGERARLLGRTLRGVDGTSF